MCQGVKGKEDKPDRIDIITFNIDSFM